MSKQKGKAINILSDVDAAYIAAFIDGEGCITISRKKCNDGTRGGFQYRLYVQISNTNKDVMMWLKDKTGLGNLYFEKKTKLNKRAKRAYRWGLWSIQAKQLIEAIRPFLIIKREQAKIGIEFINSKRDGVGRKGLTDSEWNFQIDKYNQIKALNKRGARPGEYD